MRLEDRLPARSNRFAGELFDQIKNPWLIAHLCRSSANAIGVLLNRHRRAGTSGE